MTQKEFNEQIKTGKILVDFYANWCGPCKMLSSHLREAENTLKELDVKILKVNIDESEELSNQYKVSFIPMVILFIDGALKAKFTGVKDKDSLIQFVKENL